MNKYLCYKLTYHDLEVLSETLKEYDRQNELVEMNSLDKVLDESFEAYHMIFLYLDESLSLDKLEKIIKKAALTPLNIVFKNKNFDALLLCHRFHVNFVFERGLEKQRLENSLIKASIQNRNSEDKIPTVEVMKLFSAPIKIKGHDDLYAKLNLYFSSFSSVLKFGVLHLKDGGHKFFGDTFNPTIFKSLFHVKTSHNYIGNEVILNEQVIATPLFFSEEEKLWAVIEIDQKSHKFILNHLFYKYLENVLIYRTNKIKEKSYEEMSVTDDVTGLYNQRKLSKDLDRIIKEHEKAKQNFSIMFLDVDHFKSVNDKYGHLVGSQLLTEIGQNLKKQLRGSDLVYRYGGDEYVVVMPHVKIEVVHKIALRILKKIKEIDFKITDDEIYKLSLSIGIAEYPKDADTAKDIVKFADDMMYMSKKSGRGKVFHLNEVKNATTGSK